MKYWIRKPKDGEIIGPHTSEEIKSKITTGLIPTESELLEAQGQRLGALKGSKDWFSIDHFLKSESLAQKETLSAKSGGFNNKIFEELKKSNEHLSGIKWACRSVALLLAVIVFFGVKLTFQ